MKNILYIAILTTVIVVVWIALSVYHNAKTSTITPTTDIQIKKIPATFDMKAIEGLSKRTTIPVDLHEQVMTAPVASPTGVVSPSVTPGPSKPVASVTPEAAQIISSSSGTINNPILTP